VERIPRSGLTVISVGLGSGFTADRNGWGLQPKSSELASSWQWYTRAANQLDLTVSF